MQADKEALEILLEQCREARKRVEAAYTADFDPINGGYRLMIDDPLKALENMLLTLIPEAPTQTISEPIYLILLGRSTPSYIELFWEIFYYHEESDQYMTSSLKEDGENGFLNDGFNCAFNYQQALAMIERFELKDRYQKVEVKIRQGY